MYSWLGFMEEAQIRSLHCRSMKWRSHAIRLYATGMPMLGNVESAPYEYIEQEGNCYYDYLEDSILMFVSRGLAEFLKGKINAEFLPVDIVFRDELAKGNGYVLMHLLDHLKAIDLERSDFDEYPDEAGGGISRIRKLVLKDDVIRGSMAFVSEEIAGVFLRNDLCNAIAAAGFEGLRFQPVEKATFGC